MTKQPERSKRQQRWEEIQTTKIHADYYCSGVDGSDCYGSLLCKGYYTYNERKVNTDKTCPLHECQICSNCQLEYCGCCWSHNLLDTSGGHLVCRRCKQFMKPQVECANCGYSMNACDNNGEISLKNGVFNCKDCIEYDL